MLDFERSKRGLYGVVWQEFLQLLKPVFQFHDLLLNLGERRFVGFGRKTLLAEVNKRAERGRLRLVQGRRVDKNGPGATRAVGVLKHGQVRRRTEDDLVNSHGSLHGSRLHRVAGEDAGVGGADGDEAQEAGFVRRKFYP